MSQLAFDAAKNGVDFFTDQTSQIMQDHSLAMACRDCEDFLQMGIDAFRWLQRAEENIRDGAMSGAVSFNLEVDEAITRMYEKWLGPCDDAEMWVAEQLRQGFTPDNLNKFRACCEEVRDTIEKRSLCQKARTARQNCSKEDAW